MFKSSVIDIGKSCFTILKLFMRWMVLSTCILYLAILLVLISSSSENCTWSPRKGGMFNKKPGGKSSPISKPLSAIRKSPCSSNFKIPQSFVNCLSDVLPAYTVQKQKLNHLLEKSWMYHSHKNQYKTESHCYYFKRLYGETA